MLKKVSLGLSKETNSVSVIGRNQQKLDAVVSESSSIVPLALDYNDLASLQERIQLNMKHHGAYDIVVAWIHDKTVAVLPVIHQEMKHVSNEPWELNHVLGSSSDIEQIKKQVPPSKGINYFQAQLGFKVENKKSRWLTNDEISNGVLEGIQEKRGVLIGQLEPWKLRP